MNREQLLEKLELVKPALSKSKLVPVFQNFWFLETEKLVAYNGEVAISTDLDSGVHCAVSPTLVDLLASSKAQTVEVIWGPKSDLVIKADDSKFKVAYLTLPEGLLEIPVMGTPLPVDIGELARAIQFCMPSLGEDPALPDSMGLTIVGDGHYLDLYATDNETIVYSVVVMPDKVPDFKAVLPALFCKELVAFSKLEGSKYLEITSDYALFICEQCRLYGQLIKVKNPLDFASIIDAAQDDCFYDLMILIPDGILPILNRAIAIKGTSTQITIEDGQASFFTVSERGEVRDQMRMDGHPDVDVRIDPRLFKRGLKMSSMLLTKQFLIMTDKNDVYLVSAAS